jgi:toxin ParE1/3/4
VTYKISLKAVEDIESIWLYTYEKWSLEQADRYVNLIMDEIEYLSAHPNSGKNINHLRKGYRQAKVKSHLIFYQINGLQNEIEIIRVLHQQMDIPNRLND